MHQSAVKQSGSASFGGEGANLLHPSSSSPSSPFPSSRLAADSSAFHHDVQGDAPPYLISASALPSNLLFWSGSVAEVISQPPAEAVGGLDDYSADSCAGSSSPLSSPPVVMTTSGEGRRHTHNLTNFAEATVPAGSASDATDGSLQSSSLLLQVQDGMGCGSTSTNLPSTSKHLPFERGFSISEIASASLVPSTATDADAEKKRRLSDHPAIICKEKCFYCLSFATIPGRISLTKESLWFEPDSSCATVCRHGLGTYQVLLDLRDVRECAYVAGPGQDFEAAQNRGRGTETEEEEEEGAGFLQLLVETLDGRRRRRSSSFRVTSSPDPELDSPPSCDASGKSSQLEEPRCSSPTDICSNEITSTNSNTANGSSSGLAPKHDPSMSEEEFEYDASSSIPASEDNDADSFTEEVEYNQATSTSGASPTTTTTTTTPIQRTIHCTAGSSPSTMGGGKRGSSRSGSAFLRVPLEAVSPRKAASALMRRVRHNIRSPFSKRSSSARTSGESERRSGFITDQVEEDKEPAEVERKTVDRSEVEEEKEEGKGGNKGEEQHVDSVNPTEDTADDTTRQELLEDLKEMEKVYEVEKGKTITNIDEQGSQPKKEDEAMVPLKKIDFDRRLIPNIFILFKFSKKAVAQQVTVKLISVVDQARSTQPAVDARGTLTSVPFDSNGLLEQWMEGSGPIDDWMTIRQQIPSEFSSASLEAPPQQHMEEEVEDLREQQFMLQCVNLYAPSYTIPEGASKLVTDSIAAQITSYLPPTIAIRTWKLAFCPKLHGISFSTFYRNVSDRGSCVLLVRDTKGTIFGGFSSEAFQMGHKYYGSGEMFVFTFKPENASLEDTGDGKENPIRVFHWSTANAFFLFSDNQTIAIGGGGHYAITIDRDLLIGSSSFCPTFNSPCLASAEDFVVKDLQVWVFKDY